MTGRFEHPSYFGRLSQTRSMQVRPAQARSNQAQSTQAQASAVGGPFARYRPTSRYSERACCCSAQAAVIVLLPPTDGRPHAVDLLLCGHHFRQSRTGLLAKGAAFLDLTGCRLAADGWLLPSPQR